MGEEYYCCNCARLTDMDTHGRCEHCQSLAVDIAVRPRKAEPVAETPTVAELERLYRA